eukprot:672530-Pelagomonas_calceolata.AAC.3
MKLMDYRVFNQLAMPSRLAFCQALSCFLAAFPHARVPCWCFLVERIRIGGVGNGGFSTHMRTGADLPYCRELNGKGNQIIQGASILGKDPACHE